MQFNRKYIITLLLGLTLLFRFIAPAYGAEGHCDRMLAGEIHCCCMSQSAESPLDEPIVKHAGCGCEFNELPETEGFKSHEYTKAPSPRMMQEVMAVLSVLFIVQPSSAEELPHFGPDPYRTNLSSRHKLALYSTLLI
ncbi:MAG: hypothetical protein RR202_05055 [Bacteroidales bacterium]